MRRPSGSGSQRRERRITSGGSTTPGMKAARQPKTAMSSEAIRPHTALPSGKEMTISASRSEEHTSELQSLMRISYAVFCLKKTKTSDYNMHSTVEMAQQRVQNNKHT